MDKLCISSRSVEILCDLIDKYNPHGLLIHETEMANIGIANGEFKILTRNIDDFGLVDEIELIEI